MMKYEEFAELAKQYNAIPVSREVIADLETPVSVLSRLADEENLFLLESVEGGERFGRYSFIGLNPKGIFTVENGRAFYRDNGKVKREMDSSGGALFAMRELLKGVKAYSPPGLPPLFGGAVGFMGYETVNQFERLPKPKAPLSQPESAFMLTDEVIIFDNQRHVMTLSVCVHTGEHATERAAYDYARERLDAMAERLSRPLPAKKPLPAAEGECRLTPVTGREAYMKMVEEARKYIHDGELIQVVLSQKFTAPLTVEPLQLYRALRLINPSPYTFFTRIGEDILIGSSPETLCKLENNVATVRPIAGTRKRGATATRDRELADELLNDEKERAEHLMLVDLGRNDLGRIALPGSVQVKDFMNVERYSHVMHLVSTVEALPRAEVDAFDVVRAAFPAGTLSGAPKVRAMELIHQLEALPRNAYAGAAGYFSYSHNMDLAITIRTFTIRDGVVTMQAGAGIVFDSDPAREDEECRNKAAALFKAIELAANGLELNAEEKQL